MRVSRISNRYKVEKHFDIDIDDASITFSVDHQRVAAEAALDGFHVIRTTVDAADMAAEEQRVRPAITDMAVYRWDMPLRGHCCRVGGGEIAKQNYAPARLDAMTSAFLKCWARGSTPT